MLKFYLWPDSSNKNLFKSSYQNSSQDLSKNKKLFNRTLLWKFSKEGILNIYIYI